MGWYPIHINRHDSVVCFYTISNESGRLPNGIVSILILNIDLTIYQLDIFSSFVYHLIHPT